VEKKPDLDREDKTPESACPEDARAADCVDGSDAAVSPENPDPAAQVEVLSARLAELEERLAHAAEELGRVTAERDTWQSKATQIFDQYNRLRADFDGYRKRTERDFQDRLIREKGEFIKELLEVMDNFDRFLAAAEKGRASGDTSFEAFYKGVVMIERQLMDVLLREGVTPIESPVGKPMDPEYHEAVAAQEGGGEHGTVVEELQKGYMYKGTLLRATRVKVIR